MCRCSAKDNLGGSRERSWPPGATFERAGATVLDRRQHHARQLTRVMTRSPCLVDVRDAVEGITGGAGTTHRLGTKYLIGVSSIRTAYAEPGTRLSADEEQTNALQFIIFSELTPGVVTKVFTRLSTRSASSCLERGAGIVGLLHRRNRNLMSDDSLPVIDSTSPRTAFSRPELRGSRTL